ncbi:MAG: N-acetylglutamate synthase-like GNAT family acetyltransferase [Oleiphilaceae bacterium]|jgi:N-acetylglutamate synthase-like GNAT family acetyltransferase
MMHSNHFHFEQIPTSHYQLVKSFYKKSHYFNQVGRKDEVFALREISQHNRIIAAARLVKTADYLILRSMVVLPELQKQGIGKYFLEHLKPSLINRSCWCFPFEWLECFYAGIGFKPYFPEDAPALIRRKYQQYSDQGRKILIMSYP